MNFAMLIRADIFYIIILFNLLFYCYEYKKYRNVYKGYIYIVHAALGHIVFELITVITVNMQGQMPKWIIDLTHFLYYEFMVIFSVEYYHYILSLFVPKLVLKKVMIPAYIIEGVVAIAVLLFGIEYHPGKGTYYSTGIGVKVCFAMCFWLLLVTTIVILMYRKHVGEKRALTLAGIVIVSVVLVVLQFYIPEFLASGGILTLFCFNLFLAIEDPFKTMENEAFIDYTTGMFNRNCYEHDLEELKDVNVKMGVVMCDLNYLKYINDKYGHNEGDRLINIATDTLTTYLASANRIYRVGGDEFIAFYKSDKTKNMDLEVAEVQDKCSQYSKSLALPIEIAMGSAVMEPGESIEAMIKRADEIMYKNKQELKKNSNIPSR